MKMKKAVIFALIAIIMAQAALAAITIEITPQKAEFKEGDLLAFDYKITSGTKQDIVYMPHISCPSAPVALLERKTANLNAGIPLHGEYRGAIIDGTIEPQTCTAKVTILAPEKKKAEKNIKIASSPSFDLSLNACKDSACSKKQRTFVKGENVYLKADSKVSAPATASITFPDETKKTVALPGRFAASQSGEYTIEISAAKSGYKPFASISSLFVIEQAFTVPYADFSAKVGQAVVRPVFKAPSALAASNTATKAPVTTAKKTSIKSFFSRITGYFTRIF